MGLGRTAPYSFNLVWWQGWLTGGTKDVEVLPGCCRLPALFDQAARQPETGIVALTFWSAGLSKAAQARGNMIAGYPVQGPVNALPDGPGSPRVMFLHRFPNRVEAVRTA
jgi:hypothetical protein